MVLLSACATAPKKPTPLPNTQVNKLKNMRLDNRLPVPVKGVSRSQLRDTWGAARSQGRSHEGIDIMAERGTTCTGNGNGHAHLETVDSFRRGARKLSRHVGSCWHRWQSAACSREPWSDSNFLGAWSAATPHLWVFRGYTPESKSHCKIKIACGTNRWLLSPPRGSRAMLECA